MTIHRGFERVGSPLSPGGRVAGDPSASPGMSKGYLTTYAVLVTMTLAGIFLVLVAAPLPIEQAEASRDWTIHESVSTLPDPHSAMSDILCALPTPLAFSHFLKLNSSRYRHHDPYSYTRQFRLDLDEFQKVGWAGDCNDFANVMGELGYRHGYPMGLVSMWPERWQDRLHKDWHQIAVLCVKQDRLYLVFEFDNYIWWHGTLAEYAKSQGKSIIPVGGVIDWHPTKKNFLARFVDHLRSNVVLPENDRPLPLLPVSPMT